MAKGITKEQREKAKEQKERDRRQRRLLANLKRTTATSARAARRSRNEKLQSKWARRAFDFTKRFVPRGTARAKRRDTAGKGVAEILMPGYRDRVARGGA